MQEGQMGNLKKVWPWLDPFRPVGKYRPLIYFLLFLFVVCFQGPRFLASLPGNLVSGGDFFQDWASANDWLAGRSLYADLSDSLNHLLNIQVSKNEVPGIVMDIQVNAHPPFSLFMVIPFALLGYESSVLAWNLFSLLLFLFSIILVWRTLELPWHWWSIFSATLLFLQCGPIQSQIIQGQWNFILLFLIVCSWLAHRENKPWLAGIPLGLAAAIKLTPLFLILIFVIQRKWKSLFATVITFAICNLIAVIVFGMHEFQDYIFRVLPLVKEFEGSVVNASWNGFIRKLFFPEHNEFYPPFPLLPAIGKTLVLILQLVFTTFFIVMGWRTMPEKTDRYFFLGIIVMLLISPITWDHYLILALPALALSWKDLRHHPILNLFFILTLILFCIYMGDLQYGIKNLADFQIIPQTIYCLTVLSIPTYALLLLFALVLYPIFRKPQLPLN